MLDSILHIKATYIYECARKHLIIFYFANSTTSKSRKTENNQLIIKRILNCSSKSNKICDLVHSHITFITQV